MADFSTDKVRNVVLVGQDGAGKTSLAEAMLHLCGRTDRLGTTSDGKSNMDYDAEEIKRKFTISTSLGSVTYKNTKINILDTSGSPDFIGDTIAALYASEAAIFVIDAVAGPQVMAIKLWENAIMASLAKTIYINHIDRENSDFDAIINNLTERFGKRVGPVAIPMGVESDFHGVIDLVRMKARIMDGGKEEIQDIPAEYADAAEMYREQLIESIAEADDDIMMKYLDGEELTQEDVELALKNAIEMGVFMPIYVGSTLTEYGVSELLDDIVDFFPAPDKHGSIPTEGGDSVKIGLGTEPAAYVFKTLSDPYVGRLSFIKVVTGSLKPGDELINFRNGRKEKLAHIYTMIGSKTEEMTSACPGDVVVIPKLNEVRTNDTLSQSGKIKFNDIPFPQPLYPVAIEASNKNDEDKMGTFFAQMAEIDPCIVLTRNDETHQSLLYTLGEGVVDLLKSRLKDRSNIDVNIVDVRVPYRETIRKTASAQGRHKKQTGGAGQFGDCWLRLEPNPGGGYEFIDEIVGGKIPRGFIPAVDKGVQAAMEEGFLAGYPMVDIKCAVYDGSYHPVDSNEMAFKLAARLGFRNCCEKADPYILEPMANIEVTVSGDYDGAIMSDFSTRRGRVTGMDHDTMGNSVIMARVPYSEVVSYAKDLRSLTRGNGTYTIELEGYEEAPYDVAQKLIAEYQAARAEGNK
ncbi:MAG: elongation factor G [Coriobacteriales bacterium]